MRCRHDDSAVAAMPGDEFRRQRSPLSIERGERLVEQPERSADQHQARKRDAFLLSGGKILHRKIADAAQAHAIQHRVDVAAMMIAREKFQIFGWRQLWFDPVRVSKPTDKLRTLFRVGDCFTGAASQCDAPRTLFEKTCNQPQQRRFPGTVRTFDRKHVACGNIKAQFAEKLLLPARERESFTTKSPQCRHA